MKKGSKKDIITDMLGDGLVYIQLDTNCPGVDVPKEFKRCSSMGLNLSYAFRSKLEISDFGVVADLSFSRKSYVCHIPWKSIWLVRQVGTTILFKEDVPAGASPAFLEELPASDDVKIAAGEDIPAPPKPTFSRGHLRLIK